MKKSAGIRMLKSDQMSPLYHIEVAGFCFVWWGRWWGFIQIAINKDLRKYPKPLFYLVVVPTGIEPVFPA
jgi:hypothetical protein